MEPSTITIRNKQKRVRVFNLPAPVVPELSLKVPTASRGFEVRKRGAEAKKPPRFDGHKRVGGSITLQPDGSPGDIVRGLPMSVRRAPEIMAAVAAREIVVDVIKNAESDAAPAHRSPQAERRSDGPSAGPRKKHEEKDKE